jgi:hypothetical protein
MLVSTFPNSVSIFFIVLIEWAQNNSQLVLNSALNGSLEFEIWTYFYESKITKTHLNTLEILKLF